MDGIIPTSAIPNAQAQLGQQYAFDPQNLITQLQSKLPIGTTMMAMVLGNDKNGNIIVKANGSDLLLSSPLALAKGAQVQLKIETVGGHITAQILSVDGKLPVYRPQGSEGQYQTPMQKGDQNSVPVKIVSVLADGAARVAQPQVNNAAATIRVDQVNLSSPQTTTFRAMVISPSPEIMQGVRATLALSIQSEEKLIKTLPSELKAGMEANVRIAGVVSEPKTSSAPAALQTPAQNPENEKVETGNNVLKGQDWMKQEANPALLKPQPQPQPQTFEEPQAQQSTTPTTTQQPKPQPFSQPQLPEGWVKDFVPTMKALPNGNLQMNALVVDNMRDGEMTVETKLGLMLVNNRGDGKAPTFPRGTELQLEMTEFTKLDVPAKIKNELPALSHEWPALKTALAENKHEAQKIAGSEHNFGAKLVNFMNAVKTGDAESWLGAEFLDQLDDVTRSVLVNKLNGDFANFRNLMAENPQNPWQTMLFPVFDGQELNQARLHVKKFKDDSAASADGFGTRFIVELDTSRYGEMQFDGLVRRLVPKKSFDLIIRTHVPLDDQMKSEIKGIFNTTQDITGFNGAIEFASGPQFPVEPWKDLMNKKGPHDNLIS